jgi:hypothetical protein
LLGQAIIYFAQGGEFSILKYIKYKFERSCSTGKCHIQANIWSKKAVKSYDEKPTAIA